jgi:hypothetical protein
VAETQKWKAVTNVHISFAQAIEKAVWHFMSTVHVEEDVPLKRS